MNKEINNAIISGLEKASPAVASGLTPDTCLTTLPLKIGRIEKGCFDMYANFKTSNGETHELSVAVSGSAQSIVDDFEWWEECSIDDIAHMEKIVISHANTVLFRKG